MGIRRSQAGSGGTARVSIARCPLQSSFLGFMTVGLCVGAGASAPWLTAGAQALEEVVVTARKREERLVDVPISIAAVGGQEIRSQAFDDMQDLSSIMPNVLITRTIQGDNVRVRGLGSGINFGIEQAVGTVIDGFYYGSRRFSRMGFLDVERVEVLKGPQGALIGKNTTAGAINITTARPSDEFEVLALAEYEIEEAEGVTFEGAVSGPLTDGLSARAAFRIIDSDSYMENIVLGEDQPQIEDWVGRVGLLWEANENLDAFLQYTHFDTEYKGGDQQAWLCDQTMLAFYAANNVPLECGLNLKRKEVAPENGVGNAEIFTTEIDTLGLTVDWEFGGGHVLTSLTGWAQLEGLDRAPADKTPLELGNTRLVEDYEQFTQEFRIASPQGDRFDYIVGFYYGKREQDTEFALDINFIPVSPPRPPIAFSSPVFTNEESDSYALFGQLSWHITDQLTATIDGRYTREEKDADQIEFPAAIYSLEPAGPPRHQLSRDRNEDDFSPGLAVQWRPNDDTNIYGSIRQGFKSGGFNHQISATQEIAELSFEFEDEQVTAYELGSKFVFAELGLQFNAAVFYNEYEDLQVDIFDNTAAGIPFVRVANAAEATTSGLELEATWSPTENLRLFGSIAYLDAEYDDYPGAACYVNQTPAEGCSVGPDGVPGTRDDSQNLGGQVLKFAPEYSGVFNAEYTLPIGRSLALTGFLQAIYNDEYSSSDDNDPFLFQDDEWKFDARITLGEASGRWDVSLIGRNITDETTLASGSDIAGIVPGDGYNVRIDPPRSVLIQGRVAF